jgi:hypothetical protein
MGYRIMRYRLSDDMRISLMFNGGSGATAFGHVFAHVWDESIMLNV